MKCWVHMFKIFEKQVEVKLNLTVEEYRDFIISEVKNVLSEKTNYVIDKDLLSIKVVSEDAYYTVVPSFYVELDKDVIYIDKPVANKYLRNQRIVDFKGKKVFGFDPTIRNVNEQGFFIVDMSEDTIISKSVSIVLPKDVRLMTIQNQMPPNFSNKKTINYKYKSCSGITLAIKCDGEFRRLVVLRHDYFGKKNRFYCLSDNKYKTEKELYQNYKKDVNKRLNNYPIINQMNSYNIHDIINNIITPQIVEYVEK